MKLTVFPSDQGDCLLLTSKDGRNVLIDGGMAASYRRYVAPRLAVLGKAGKTLDAVYVSHIDADHIGGILELVNDALRWKVFAIHLGEAPDDGVSPAPDEFKRPSKTPRPPAIGKFWYNAFSAMIPDDDGRLEAALVQATTALAAGNSDLLRDAALAGRELVTSIRQGIQLTHRLDERQLGYPLNPEFGGGLMQIERGNTEALKTLPIGTMTFHAIGPFREDLAKLEREWKQWVADHEADMRRLEEDRREDERDLAANEFERLQRALRMRAAQLGRRAMVTTPNLASLMFLVEEGDASILLTGDGHWQDILDGLAAWGRLDAAGGIHVDVLKVQHHGSEHNLNEEFCRRVTANHYLFCANGAHENPDRAVLKAIVDSRLGPPGVRSSNPQAKNRFRFWFNNSATFEDGAIADNVRHLEDVQNDVGAYVAMSHGRMSAQFVSDPRWRDKQRLELTING
jgi:beta-lactamase superfamily II metal-dependent hydrolase